ncbi:hypothetical protein MTR67_040121 [Solanum verrucosum]|uniref:Uncharacterized protein n=1 Tax=Solanum verrucosum TaxID=315347 RepID=A0AAF0UJU2_SOLVR|nr:hypothetical protein MTR67_040121 [Solanum verrucosum]
MISRLGLVHECEAHHIYEYDATKQLETLLLSLFYGLRLNNSYKDMAPSRAYVRRNAGDNEELEVPQVFVDPLNEQVTHPEFQVAFQMLAQAMTTQANKEFVARVNPNLGMEVIRIRYFSRMNTPEFHGLKMDDDPQELIDEIYKIVGITGVSIVEKEELVAYQLKGVTNVWFKQWKEQKDIDVGPLDWEKFKGAFLDRFFPLG